MHNNNDITSDDNYNIELSDEIINKAFMLLIPEFKGNTKNSNSIFNWGAFINKTETIIWGSKKQSDKFIKDKNQVLNLLQQIISTFNKETHEDTIKIKQCLDLLNKVKFKITLRNNNIYYTIAYFPLFLNVAIRILQSCIKVNIYNKDSVEIKDFFACMQFYMEDIIETAFLNRKLSINLYQNKNLVYVFDTLNNEVLTEKIVLQSNIQFEFTEVQDLLKSKVAEKYIQDLPIDTISKVLNLLSGSQLFKSWNEYKCRLLQPDVVKVLNSQHKPHILPFNTEKVYELITDEVRLKYFPEIAIVNKSLFNSTTNYGITPNTEKTVISYALGTMLKAILSYSASQTGLALLASPGIGALATGISFLIDQFFPSVPPVTMDMVMEAINKAIAHALDKCTVDLINAKYKSAVNAYLQRMQYINNKNKDIADKSKWDLGSPKDWESAINSFEDLKQYFFMNNYNFQYQTSDIFIYFVAMYLTLLYGKLQTYKEGEDVSVEKSMLDEFVIGWYNYLNKLAYQAWNATLDMSDSYRDRCIIHKPFATIKYYRIFDNYNKELYPEDIHNTSLPNKDYPIVSSPIFYYNSLYYPLHILEGRFRLFATINTNLRSVCMIYDESVIKYNSMFNSNLPDSSVSNIFDYQIGDKWYSSTMNYYYSQLDNNINKYTGQLNYKYALPGLNKNFASNNNFNRNDAFVEVQFDNESYSYYYCCGDYVNLKKYQNGIKFLKIPRGFRVFLYSQPNYAGSCNIYPTDTDYERFEYNNLYSTYKSMKIRLDFGFWFDNPYSKNYLRLQNIERSTNNKGEVVIGNIKLVDVPINPNPDNYIN